MGQLKDIFQPYFDWMTSLFGHLASEADRNNLSATEIARDYLSDPGRRESVVDALPEFRSSINSFWRQNHSHISLEVSKLTGLKAKYGGDIGPHFESAIFQRAGLYFDTILVPDPLLRVARLLPASLNTEYFLLKYGIEQTRAKDVYLAEVDPPIAILVPDHELLQPRTDFTELAQLAELDCILLTNELYGQEFDEFSEVQNFYTRFKNLAEAIALIKKPDLIYFDEDVPANPGLQVDATIALTKQEWDLGDIQVNPDSPEFLLYIFQGRMMQVNDILRTAIVHNAHPLLSAEVSYHWLVWKIKANQQAIVNPLGMRDNIELELTNSLLSERLKWISNVQIDDLVLLRQRGELFDLRSIITKEMNRLSHLDLTKVDAVAKQVDYNLSTALKKHQNEIAGLDKELRTNLALSGSTLLLAVAASLQPSLSPTIPELIQFLPKIIGVSSLSKVLSVVRSYLRDRRRAQRSPVGILWNAKQKEGTD